MKISVCRLSFLGGLCGAAVVLASDAAAFVTVYGGPEYVSSTDVGYTVVLELGNLRTPVNNSGDAVGWAGVHPGGSFPGNRAVQWGVSGGVELSHLGTSAGGTTETLARDVNDSGSAVGFAEKYEAGALVGKRAVRWDNFGASATALGVLGTSASGSTSSEAYAVAENGTAVGVSAKYDAGVDKGTRAVRWSGSGAVATELDSLGTDSTGVTAALAYDLNASGVTVGWASKYVGGSYRGNSAVRWDGAGTSATELGHLGLDFQGSSAAQALAINDGGVAVGLSTKFVSGTDKGERAVRWDALSASATELDNLGTDFGGSTNTRALAINASGVVVGYGSKYDADVIKGDRAMRWDASGTGAFELANLGTSSGGVTNTYARDVNEAGIIAGYARKFENGNQVIGNRAVVWMPDGGIVDLNTLVAPGSGWTLREAYNISDAGWVAGVGTFNPPGPEAAYSRHFVLQLPVPEPATLSGGLVGFALLVTHGRRAGWRCGARARG